MKNQVSTTTKQTTKTTRNLSLSIALCCSLMAGCSNSPQTNVEQVSSQNQQQNAENQAVNQLVNRYFHESMKLYPIMATFNGYSQYNDKFEAPIGTQSRAQSLALEQQYLDKINQIDASKLTGQSLLTYEVFKYDREMEIAGAKHPHYMIPINQMSGYHNSFAGLGSGKSAQPFNSTEDYENFIARSQGFIAWMDSAVQAMQQGLDSGVTLPKVLAKKMLPQLKAQIKSDITKSIFWYPITNMPTEIRDSDRKRITQAYRHLIGEQLMPAYQRMADFIEHKYIPNARESIALTDVAGGDAWYQHQIKYNTTLDLTADEIHQIGLSEVSRILKEMKLVKQQVNFDGDLPAFFNYLKTDDKFYFETEQDLIDGYNNIKDRIESKLPLLFNIEPKAPYIVRAVEKYRAASAAGASYQSPAPDGSRPGIFYINSHNLKAQPKFLMETLSIHEAAPGHHFQLALQQEIEDLPDYRKFGGSTAYAEGWALYAESLGKEMGLFTDPFMWYGRLVDEQLRAMRLVVDTGMHAMGWSREQAIQYMIDNSSMAESDITAEVERYIAWPGQALSYKIGQIKIRELRNYAEQQLGKDFDVREFHTQVLIDGSLPMPILENKIKRWVNGELKRSGA